MTKAAAAVTQFVNAVARAPGHIAAVRLAAQKAGVDLTQLDRDLSARGAEIDRILGKTDVEARTLQLQGTSGFVIGHSLVPGALSLDDLEHLVAQARTEN